jgi:hypothetical protein
LRNKILYVYTENLSFFYKLNKELNRLNIKFKILNQKSKFPDIPALILTTKKELNNHKKIYKNLRVLAYDDMENFSCYILKIIAVYRLNFKENYSELTFSIDPGSKRIGMVVILDDYFLNSHTFFEMGEFVQSVKDYVNCFKFSSSNNFKLTFKFGSGILQIAPNIIKLVISQFDNRENLKVYLIDESKSSKIKIQNKKKLFRTKHEFSALILALRSGVEVKQLDKLKNYRYFKKQESNMVNGDASNVSELNKPMNSLRDIIEKILNNEISITKSSKLFNYT